MTTAYALDLATGKLTTLDLTGPAALYRDDFTDTLYMASLNDVYALFSGTTRVSGSWKQLVVMPQYESLGWLQIESDFLDADGSSVTATVTVTSPAGATLATATVSDRTPVRLAPFYEREFYVEVASKARIASVTLTTTPDELKAT